MKRAHLKLEWLRSRKALYLSSALAGTGAIAAGVIAGFGKETPAYAPNDNASTASTKDTVKVAAVKRLKSVLPEILGEDDASLYQLASIAQQAGDWKAADELLNQTESKILSGHLLAQRYLNKNYTATFAELNDWLAKNPSHPDAYSIYKLASAKRGAGDTRLQEVSKRPLLTGYGDDNGLGGRSNRLGVISAAAWTGRADAKRLWDSVEDMIDANKLDEAEATLASEKARTLLETVEFDVARWHLAANYLYRGNPQKAYALASRSAARSGAAIPGAHWISGLASWHLNDYAAAARHFSAMAESPAGQSPWEISSAAFWAHRAKVAIGEKAAARKYLELAASYPRTFYGVLARKAQGRALEINRSEIPTLSDADVDELYKSDAIKRAVALTQIGETEAAERELRTLFPQADRGSRVQLLSVARALNLPAVQISMAKLLSRQGAMYDVALYPEPEWKPVQGFAVDPALVFAFARQESGFRASAKSGSGALGLMQIMPDTAEYMTARLDMPQLTKDRLLDPEANMTLGQTYLNYLLENRIVSGNLIYLTASYNAGPGKVLEWNTSVRHNGDPLLFLESIPYSQTRHYVTQVLTSYWIYQEMDGRKSATAQSLASGQWPKYDGGNWRVAEKPKLNDGAV